MFGRLHLIRTRTAEWIDRHERMGVDNPTRRTLGHLRGATLSFRLFCRQHSRAGSLERNGFTRPEPTDRDSTRDTASPVQGLRRSRTHVMIHRVPAYRLHDTAGDDLGQLEHPSAGLEPGDVVHLSDGREAVVTARVETDDEGILALLEVLVAPSSPRFPS